MPVVVENENTIMRNNLNFFPNLENSYLLVLGIIIT